MKILLATDGSDFSEEAVEKVCRIARDAEIRVISAYEQPLMAVGAPYAISARYNPELEKEVKEVAATAVEKAEKKLRECFPDIGSHLTTSVVYGSPERVIVEEAENWDADMIVLGSHGYGFWERVILGSVSQAVIRHAHCSVMIVRKSKQQDEIKV